MIKVEIAELGNGDGVPIERRGLLEFRAWSGHRWVSVLSRRDLKFDPEVLRAGLLQFSEVKDG